MQTTIDTAQSLSQSPLTLLSLQTGQVFPLVPVSQPEGVLFILSVGVELRPCTVHVSLALSIDLLLVGGREKRVCATLFRE